MHFICVDLFRSLNLNRLVTFILLYICIRRILTGIYKNNRVPTVQTKRIRIRPDKLPVKIKGKNIWINNFYLSFFFVVNSQEDVSFKKKTLFDTLINKHNNDLAAGWRTLWPRPRSWTRWTPSHSCSSPIHSLYLLRSLD